MPGSSQGEVEAGAALAGTPNCPVPCDFCKETVEKKLCVCSVGSSSLQHLSRSPHPAALSIFTQGELSKNGSGKIKPQRG